MVLYGVDPPTREIDDGGFELLGCGNWRPRARARVAAAPPRVRRGWRRVGKSLYRPRPTSNRVQVLGSCGGGGLRIARRGGEEGRSR